jgi:hypothetical protein
MNYVLCIIIQHSVEDNVIRSSICTQEAKMGSAL